MASRIAEEISIAATPVNPGSVSPGVADTGGVDLSLYDSAVAILHVGAFGGSATVDAKWQESVDNSAFTDVAGSNVAITQLAAAGGNNRLARMELHKSKLSAGRRYARVRVVVGTAATTLSCLILGVKASKEPVANIAAVAQSIVA